MKVVETKYGIQITKPWNNEMYDHNDKVAELMKAELLIKLELAKETDDEELLRKVSSVVCPTGYGSGYEFEDIYNETLRELEMVENYWLNEEYPYGVSKGIVPSVELEFIGY
jgi:hypothetical protein|tara:strand:- start:6152 stop:6487 length:336 start_codon:yes stop_codon:yes gene_type:complete